jgi:predicted RNA-binding Zn-ribbon protein involved in translation (DUF1610 family)
MFDDDANANDFTFCPDCGSDEIVTLDTECECLVCGWEGNESQLVCNP